MTFRVNIARFSNCPGLQVIVIGLVAFIPLIMAEMDIDKTVEFNFSSESKSCRTFSSKLYKNVADFVTESIITSPFSLHIVLSYLCHGARGKTAKELQNGLDIDDIDHQHINYKNLISFLNQTRDDERLSLANAIYVDNRIELMDDFLNLGKDYYNFTVSKTDFSDRAVSTAEINGWASERTNKKIQDVISSRDITEETRIILINALYFKGSWLYAFDEEKTTVGDFWTSENVHQKIAVMSNEKKFASGEVAGLNSRFLEIPYSDENLSMVIVLPNEKTGLSHLEKNFNWETIINAEWHKDETTLYLPKFKIESTINYNDILRNMGMKSIFDDVADFSGISESPLKVTKVLQKAFIAVDEKGSEAAAVTTTQMRSRRMVVYPNEFKVDRPFMIVINHKLSKIPIFIGSVRNILADDSKNLTKDEL